MNAAAEVSEQPDLAEPHLRGVLAGAGLDVEYVRASGNTLYMRSEDGAETPVLDCAGGYGSLLLGHNNPEINRLARSLLEEEIPVHAQFSVNGAATALANGLNRILRRELETDEPYFAIFASTGAEAVEAAVKHAEMDRVMRLAALGDELSAHAESARAAVRQGAATVPRSVHELLGLEHLDDAGEGFELLAAECARRNAGAMTAPPVFLAPEGAFHGKLAASVQLTHNEAYRMPFASLAAQARFVPTDQPGALRKIVEAERRTALDLVVSDGAVTVAERALPVFCAFLIEPIQGEGGIRELSPEFAAEVQEVCREIGCPVVVDEIQSGMGRTGRFLAGSHIGLRGDYYVLAKTLGGGVAKASVALIRESCYRREFELVHSSTFAKDGFSCRIALKVLELLEADDGRAYRMAAERGERLFAMLESVRADFPDQVHDIRGRGLMLGLEFADQSDASSEIIAGIAQGGYFGYVVAGYLLRYHGVRTFPTASAVNTLRFEPSIHLRDDEIDVLEEALRDVCALLRDQDGGRLAPS